ncbi:FAD-dependent oxidoreductase [Streptomyces antarcticus]|uniref:FAD-dependent oxidoreductase n=1 Tax=Streptomyces antarcticus TaxID=2996458 RepID=UPI00226FD828|nr:MULTISPECIES: FAD-dependent monooxygenase [unclassified Streptomyces]MCY0941506.1 FAD-dependent monooxygenase [Streptomyces sp. H34-AA3]MCZ4087665.1 FAD-dependent monooxygenase [Streptomyces sp. H34-S5]
MKENVDHHVPVLIVGGSLVGLCTSLFLGRHGIRHMLVEKHGGTSLHPRGRGINVRTMELFRVAGVEARIRDAASVLADNHGILQGGSLTGDDQEWLFEEIDPGGALARFSPSAWCLCSQNDIEPVLMSVTPTLGADLRYATELQSFDPDATGVTAHMKNRDTGEHLTVRADYLVAADGPRSPVREQLRIGQSGSGDLFHNVSITFRSRGLAEVVGDRRFIVCYLTKPDADGALLPVDNAERWVFHAPLHPDRGETTEDFTDERCVAHIRRAIGAPDLDVEITGKAPWHAAERVARRYGSGRVFLAGDSAHEMSPTGAFGSNTGIQDAHNLAWKLAAVLNGTAGPRLLDSYEAERLPVARATSERASARSAEHSHPGYEPAPETRGGRPGGVLKVAMGYRYTRGAVLGTDPALPVVPDRLQLSGEPGTRAPHLWLTGPEGCKSTVDLYERSFVLLASEGAPWRDAARRVAAQTGMPLVAYALGTGPDADLTPEDGADWAEAHGVTPSGAVLVRPDGFVAWRVAQSVGDPEAVLHEVLGRLLGLD